MAAVPHKHGGHYDEYGKVTKEQLRKVIFISQKTQGIESINKLEELFYVTSARNVLVMPTKNLAPWTRKHWKWFLKTDYFRALSKCVE